MLMKRFCERGKLLSSLFCSSCKGVDGRDLTFVLGAVTVVVVVTVTVVSGAIAVALLLLLLLLVFVLPLLPLSLVLPAVVPVTVVPGWLMVSVLSLDS